MILNSDWVVYSYLSYDYQHQLLHVGLASVPLIEVDRMYHLYFYSLVLVLKQQIRPLFN